MTKLYAVAAMSQVDLPFESFVAVKRNYVDFAAPRVNEGPACGKMLSLGIILSRFSFNEVRRRWRGDNGQ